MTEDLFGYEQPTLDEQISEVERALRLHHYTYRGARGMSFREERQLEVMQAVLHTLERVRDAEAEG